MKRSLVYKIKFCIYYICVCAYVKTDPRYDSDQNMPLVLGSRIERYSDPSSLFTATSTYLSYYPTCTARVG